MKAPEEHREFLKHRGFVPLCTNIFSSDEYAILERYGYWMTALATGKISPITPEQERFIRVDRDDCEPATTFEKAWMKLKARRKFEAEESDAPHFTVYDAAEKWFSRKDWYRLRQQ
jgi:uncharacterized protein YifE (UPF0438 family)